MEEKLEVMTLQKFVRERPDTHVGRVAKIALLQWLIAWKRELRELTLNAPITSIGVEETRRLRGQQQLLFTDDVADGTTPLTLNPHKRKRQPAKLAAHTVDDGSAPTTSK
jgi:hypothetical protein